MMDLRIGINTQHRQQIARYCAENDLRITYRSCLGSYDLYNISIEPHKLDELEMYINHLERDWMSKGFWRRLWLRLMEVTE
jgi:hypothetical protein